VLKDRSKERRKVPPRSINRVAQFCSEVSPLPRPCMVTDISDTGARLYSEIDMPPTFTLQVSGEGFNLREECRVVWRLGGELGVEFVDSRRRR
jgi:PilZ domain